MALERYTRQASKTRRNREQFENNRPMIPASLPPQHVAAPVRITVPPQRETRTAPKIVPAQPPRRETAATGIPVKFPSAVRNQPRIAPARPKVSVAAPKISTPLQKSVPEQPPKIAISPVPQNSIRKISAPRSQPTLIVPPRIIGHPIVASHAQQAAREALDVQNYYLKQAIDAARNAPQPSAEQRNRVQMLADMYNAAVRNPNITLEEAKRRVANINPNEGMITSFWRYIKPKMLPAVGDIMGAVVLPSAFAAAHGWLKSGPFAATNEGANEAFKRAWLQYAPPELQTAIHFPDMPVNNLIQNIPDIRISDDTGEKLVEKLNRTFRDTLDETGLTTSNSRRRVAIAPELQQRRLNYILRSPASPIAKLGGVMLGAYRKTVDELIREMPSVVFGASINKNYLRNAADTALINAFGPEATSVAEDLRRIGYSNVIIRPNLDGLSELRKLPTITPIPRKHEPEIIVPELKFEPITAANQYIIPIIPKKGKTEKEDIKAEQTEQIETEQAEQLKTEQTAADLADRLAKAKTAFEKAYGPYGEAKKTYQNARGKLIDDLQTWLGLIEKNPMHGDIALYYEINPGAKGRMDIDDLLKQVENARKAYTNYRGDIGRAGTVEDARSKLFQASLAKRKNELFGMDEPMEKYTRAGNEYYANATRVLRDAENDIANSELQLRTFIDNFYNARNAFRLSRVEASKQKKPMLSTYLQNKKRAEETAQKSLDNWVNYFNVGSKQKFLDNIEENVTMALFGSRNMYDPHYPLKLTGNLTLNDVKHILGYNAKKGQESLFDLLRKPNILGSRESLSDLAINIFNNYDDILTRFDSTGSTALKDLHQKANAYVTNLKNLRNQYNSDYPQGYYDDRTERDYYTKKRDELHTLTRNYKDHIQNYAKTFNKYYVDGSFGNENELSKKFFETEKKMKQQYGTDAKSDTKIDIRALLEKIDPQATLKNNGKSLIDGLVTFGGAGAIGALGGLFGLGRALSTISTKPDKLINPANPRQIVKFDVFSDDSHVYPRKTALAALETYLHDTQPPASGWSWPWSGRTHPALPALPDNKETELVDISQPKNNPTKADTYLDVGYQKINKKQDEEEEDLKEGDPEILTRLNFRLNEPTNIRTIRNIRSRAPMKTRSLATRLEQFDYTNNVRNRRQRPPKNQPKKHATELESDDDPLSEALIGSSLFYEPPKKQAKRREPSIPPVTELIQQPEPPKSGASISFGGLGSAFGTAFDTINYHLLPGMPKPEKMPTMPSLQQVQTTLAPVTQPVTDIIRRNGGEAYTNLRNAAQSGINQTTTNLLTQGTNLAQSALNGSLNYLTSSLTSRVRGVANYLPTSIGESINGIVGQSIAQTSNDLSRLGANLITNQTNKLNGKLKNLFK